jgi:hypothetical protein
VDGIIESLVTTIKNPLELVNEEKEPSLSSPPTNLKETITVSISIGGFSVKLGRQQDVSRSTGPVVFSSCYSHFKGVLNHLEINTTPILIPGIGYESMSLPSYKGFSNPKKNPTVKKQFKNEDRRYT